MDIQPPVHGLEYTVIFARRMKAMREFYGETLGLPVYHDLAPQWVEYRVGSTLLALTEERWIVDDFPPSIESISQQLAFRVLPSEVDRCAAVLTERGVTIALAPGNEPWGHKTVFFRDPDGNVLGIYAGR